jgi:hypothetical protein
LCGIHPLASQQRTLHHLTESGRSFFRLSGGVNVSRVWPILGSFPRIGRGDIVRGML